MRVRNDTDHAVTRTGTGMVARLEAQPGPDRQVTQLLDQLEVGRPVQAAELLQLVYPELRRLAAARMARLVPGQTLQATALVHEAWLRMVGDRDPGWRGRAHFFGAASRAMRDIVFDHLQAKRRLKRGGHLQRIDDDPDALPAAGGPGENELVVAEALEGLAREHPRKAEIVTMSFFGGLSTEEIAEVLGLSTRTVERDWRFARAWLNSRLGDQELAP